ncbi:OsmC family protein [uncultured Pseudoteredinibacter sp.]|uniref:OsmC family protein n=1 Tax=uncultured Pseudoteredinibacter sp. TaxID=1641701 RepID=UPI00262BBD79|nr:OsmC family protein [uncultured Pseudoteredinibacter sp.]
MASLPHSYISQSQSLRDGTVKVSVDGLSQQYIAPPSNFGGPGDVWSPEDLQSAAISSCFCLSFRAIARAAKLSWYSVHSEVELLLAKADKNVVFTEIHNKVHLVIDDMKDRETAEKALHNAESSCFISASMTAKSSMEINICQRT